MQIPIISFLILLLGFGQGGYIKQARDTCKPYYLDVQPTAPVDGWYLALGDPHRTVVLGHRLPDGKQLFTSYKHLAEVYVKNDQEVDPNTRLARLFDHLHLEVRKKLDDYGCPSWLTMTQTELNEYFTDPAAFITEHVGKK